MIPIARTEKLLIQRVGNELIVYDEANKSSHSLNSMAARVYELCDGQHTIKDIAQLLEKELHISRHEEVDIRGLVWLTLEELERYQLIKEYVKQPTGVASISRRTVIKTGALVGGFALGSMFPVVRSIVAPTPAMAVSIAVNRRAKKGEACNVDLADPGCEEGLDCSLGNTPNPGVDGSNGVCG